jgi:protein SCO1/2
VVLEIVFGWDSAKAYVQWPASSSAGSPTDSSADLKGVYFEQHLGSQLPSDLQLTDEEGKPFRIQANHSKPMILTFAYFRCANLCSLVLNGLVSALRETSLQLGQDFKVLTVSIEPSESPKLAKAKKKSYLARLEKLTSEQRKNADWHFLTGGKAEIDRLTATAGFHFKRDVLSGTYSHPSGLVILSPEGKITQYLFGIHFDPKELERGIERASKRRVGSLAEELLLFCFHYDPNSNRSVQVLALIRAAGILAVLVLGYGLTQLFLRERRT